MKHYTEESNHWKTSVALGFFANFIRNHNGRVEDNDTFALVDTLVSPDALREMVQKHFPEKIVTAMVNWKNRSDRLDFDDDVREICREIWSIPFARRRCRKMLLEIVENFLRDKPVEKFRDERFPRRVAELRETLGLSEIEMDILLVLAFISRDLLTIADGHRRRTDENDKAIFIAKCLDCDVSEVLAALDEKGKLRRYDCIDNDFDLNGDLLKFLNGVTGEPLASSYFSRCTEETLPWDFYGLLAEKHGGILKRIIRGARGRTPVNILLYGAPGTGKTSFARTLASELNLTCYAVAQNGNDRFGRGSSSPAFRFGALQVCNSQVDHAHSLIVVDEADEMLRGHCGGGIFAFFGGDRVPAGDKGLLNSILDTVTTPTVWITNTPAEALDESSRRRFDYSIRFDELNAEQRLSIWRNNVAKLKLGKLIDEEMMRRLAIRYPVSAGGITQTLKNLVNLDPAPAEVETLIGKLMAPHCELLEVSGSTDHMLPARDYSLEGVNIRGTLRLEQLVQAVRNFRQGENSGIDRPRMNILLHGAPGTGKTEFVKYLGSVLDARVVVKMGSDLLSMYVGGTEKNIRDAFAQAEAEHAILFLDELDGLLQSRERAQRSWEVTQVNELLHQMENFSGVMIGATNFAANLDAAVLRRFTFKLEFDYLDEAGKRLFFERMFEETLTPEEAARLAAIPHLAPGDYRTVRQSFFYLGNDVTNTDRLAALERESEAKQANRFAERSKVGF